MPLEEGKGKAAFSHNIAAEINAGKPKDQAAAIAYSIMRKNRAKKMAEGGEVKENTPQAMGEKCYACGGIVGMAQGGMIDEEDESLEGPHEEEPKEDDKVGFLRSYLTAKSIQKSEV